MKKSSFSATLLLGLVFCWVFYACQTPKPLEYKDVQRLHMEGMGFKNVTVGMELSLYNPNKFAVTVKEGAVDIYLNGYKLGTTNVSKQFKIPKQETFLMPINLTIEYKNILKNAMDYLTKDQVTVKVNGVIKAGKGGIYINVPINYEGKHDTKSKK